jgi:hypothetical protein
MTVRRFALLTAAALALASGAKAADITAEQSALLYDLLDPAVKRETPPPGTDPGVLKDALQVLKDKKLAGQAGRPVFAERGILDKYAKAMFLGSRGPEFASEIGEIHDLVYSGQQDRLETALSDLWVKAGRAKPDSKALEPVINSLYGEKGRQPSETIRHVFDDARSRVEVIHAVAGGRMQVDIETKNPDGTVKDRTVFSGVTETTPTKDGKELERKIEPEKICTNTPETDKDAAKTISGEWIAQSSGLKWTVETSGQSVKLTEHRASGGPLVYTGELRLGRILTRHPISKVTDMDNGLPMEVKRQLTGMGIDFRVALEFCGGDAAHLRGTWSSQHVTYDGMSLTVKKVHDPYDLSLVLGRDAPPKEEKVAEGAAPDLLP